MATIVRSREMGMTRDDFFRVLPTLVASHGRVTISGNAVTLRQGKSEVRIEVIDGQPRRLGAIAIPVLFVTFRFTGHSAEDAETFLRHFDRVFQRGGG